MKPITNFIFGLVAGVLLMVLLCLTGKMPLNCCKDKDNGNDLVIPLPSEEGIIITREEYISRSDTFKNRQIKNSKPPVGTPEGQWGGRIGKSALQMLVNNLDPAEKYVDFNFGMSSAQSDIKTYLMFQSKGKDSTGAVKSLWISNGGTSSFCPPKCPTPKPQ